MDFDEYHRRPRHGELAAPYAAGLGPIAFRLPDGRAYTFVPGERDVDVRPGVEGATTIVDVPLEQWEAFASERWTRYGLLFHGTAEFAAGSFEDLCRWEPALRALMDGRPVWDLDHLDLPDDLTRSFTLDDADADLAGFLRRAGYLHVRDVFDAAEVESLRAEVQALADGSRTDDTTTWWTRTPEGKDVVCQVKYGARRSSALAELHDDPRVRRILAAAGEDGLAPNLDRNEGTKVIFKRPGATEGLTDLPFHTDCGMGYHPIACPMVLIGVHLDRGTPASGQLHMLPGSHRSSTPDPAIVGTEGWPIVALATEPGDCTVHFGHTLHAAPPPTGALGAGEHGRRTFYLAFAPPTLFDALAPMEDLVGAMQKDDGVTKTVDDVLAH
jgi:hypothetical protein